MDIPQFVYPVLIGGHRVVHDFGPLRIKLL